MTFKLKGMPCTLILVAKVKVKLQTKDSMQICDPEFATPNLAGHAAHSSWTNVVLKNQLAIIYTY